MNDNDVVTRATFTEFVDNVSGQLVAISNHLDSAIIGQNNTPDQMAVIVDSEKLTVVFASIQVLCNNMRQIVGLEPIGEAEQEVPNE